MTPRPIIAGTALRPGQFVVIAADGKVYPVKRRERCSLCGDAKLIPAPKPKRIADTYAPCPLCAGAGGGVV